MVIIEFESRNFNFMAAGNNEDEALEALRQGFARHAQQYKCSEDWFVPDDDDYYWLPATGSEREVNWKRFFSECCRVFSIEAGQCARDYQVLN